MRSIFNLCCGDIATTRSRNVRAREMLDQNTEFLLPELICVWEPTSNVGITNTPTVESELHSSPSVHSQYCGLQSAGELSTEVVEMSLQAFLATDGNQLEVAPTPRETEPTPNGDPTEPTPDVAMDCVHDPVQVVNHRRVRKGKKIPYVQSLVAECKVRFGTPTDTMANRRSVQRYVVQISDKHGVRAAHTRTIVPAVVEMALTPDRWEVDAQQLARSRFIRTRRGKDLTLWQRVLNWWDGDWKVPPMEEC